MNEVPESASSHIASRRSRRRSSSVLVAALTMVLAAGIGGAAAFGLQSRSAWIVLPVIGATVPFWPRLIGSMGGSSYRAASTPIARWSVTKLDEPIRWLGLALLMLASASTIILWLLGTPPAHVFRYASLICIAALIGYAAWQFFPPATLGRRACACFLAWTVGICGNWAASATDRKESGRVIDAAMRVVIHDAVSSGIKAEIPELVATLREEIRQGLRERDVSEAQIAQFISAFELLIATLPPTDPSRDRMLEDLRAGRFEQVSADMKQLMESSVADRSQRGSLRAQLDAERVRAATEQSIFTLERAALAAELSNMAQAARIDLLLAMMPSASRSDDSLLDTGTIPSTAHTSFFGALIRSGDSLERAIGAVAMAAMSGESTLWTAAERAIAAARAALPSDPLRREIHAYALHILDGDREQARGDAMGALDMYLQAKQVRESTVADLRLEVTRAVLRRLSRLALAPVPPPEQVVSSDPLEAAPVNTTVVPVGSDEQYVPLVPLRTTGTAANLLLNAQRLEKRMACTTCTGGGEESYEVQVGERRSMRGFLVEKVMQTRNRRCTTCGGSGFGDAKQARQSLEGFAVSASRVRVQTSEDDNRIVLSIPEVMRALRRNNRTLPTLNDDARSIFARTLVSEPTPIWFSGRIVKEQRVIQNGEEVQLVTVRSGVDQKPALLANPIIRGASAERAEVYVFGLCTGIHAINGAAMPIIQNAVVLSP